MAVADINNNPNILPGHKLMLDIQDGQCEADIVMKKFIDFIKNKDPARFRRTVGILGEWIRCLAGSSTIYIIPRKHNLVRQRQKLQWNVCVAHLDFNASL